MTSSILFQCDDRGCATLTLNRPELHNAFDDEMIAALTALLKRLEGDAAVRLVQLAASGKSFCAGADLNWMRRMAAYAHEENLADAGRLAELMRTLNSLKKPTIALVQGAAYGGGVGLVACCDIVLATRRASFCLSEVKLGLVPAVVSPYVVEAIGIRAARRYFQSAESFDAAQAQRLGLVHEVALDDAELQGVAQRVVSALLRNGPEAMAEAKALSRLVARSPLDDRLIAATVESIAQLRSSAEGKEGVAAFLEKRSPSWLKTGRTE